MKLFNILSGSYVVGINGTNTFSDYNIANEILKRVQEVDPNAKISEWNGGEIKYTLWID